MEIPETEWKDRFSKAKASANKHTEQLITIFLQRMYTLRNQIIHDRATWNSSANRTQISDSVTFLSQLVPSVIDIMMNSPEQLWEMPNIQ